MHINGLCMYKYLCASAHPADSLNVYTYRLTHTGYMYQGNLLSNSGAARIADAGAACETQPRERGAGQDECIRGQA